MTCCSILRSMFPFSSCAVRCLGGVFFSFSFFFFFPSFSSFFFCHGQNMLRFHENLFTKPPFQTDRPFGEYKTVFFLLPLSPPQAVFRSSGVLLFVHQHRRRVTRLLLLSCLCCRVRLTAPCFSVATVCLCLRSILLWIFFVFCFLALFLFLSPPPLSVTVSCLFISPNPAHHHRTEAAARRVRQACAMRLWNARHVNDTQAQTAARFQKSPT